jgi:hypothetical protein
MISSLYEFVVKFKIQTKEKEERKGEKKKEF